MLSCRFSQYFGVSSLLNRHVLCNRCYSPITFAGTSKIFDRRVKVIQRERSSKLKDYVLYDKLKNEVGWRLFDRICDIKRHFPVLLDLTCGRSYVSKNLFSDMVDIIYQTDLSRGILSQGEPPEEEIPIERLILDEEFLPLKSNYFDIVVSCLAMHWVNDIPKTFDLIQNALVSDGVFLGAMFGGDTLFELRVSLQKAEMEITGGASPHISPFTEPADLADLLHQANFNLITIDTDTLKITYPNMMELMRDIRGMAENNSVIKRPLHLSRKVIERAEEIYRDEFATTEGYLPATFHMLNWIGWKPDPSQPKSAARGSATISLKDIPSLTERSFITEPEEGSTDRTNDTKS